MGGSLDFPNDRALSSTTSAVADVIAALRLPSISSLANDIVGLSSLPPLPEPGSCQNIPGTAGRQEANNQLDVARSLMDSCVDAIDGMRKHQNRCAALTARLIEKLESSVALEGGILALDPWQQKISLSGMEAELAAVLQIPEWSASRLMVYATTLVRSLPATMAELEKGALDWGHAVIITQEATLLASTGIPGDSIEAFELLLLDKAGDSTLPSFREKARRLRERRHPESIVPRTRRAYTDRQMTRSHDRDGMSWLGLYAPSPTVEGIWEQCTAAAKAAQGPHENRTLTQLRVDVAAALLLNQSLADNQIYAPAPTSVPSPAVSEPEPATSQTVSIAPAAPDPGPISEPGDNRSALSPCASRLQTDSPAAFGASPELTAPETPELRGSPVDGALQELGGDGSECPCEVLSVSGFSGTPNLSPEVPEPCRCGGSVDIDRGRYLPPAWSIPVFDDPDYDDPNFRDPVDFPVPGWTAVSRPPVLLAAPPDCASNSTMPGVGRPYCDLAGNGVPWPPLPKVMPILMIPALSLLGTTNEPAWMQGVGPISMEVAKRLTSQASSFFRVLVDPISNDLLDKAPESYRITKAMRTMLLLRDEYCQFPGCMAKASSSQIDHIQSFESGGTSVFGNLEALCLHHHLVKHFKDDKSRNGQYRTDQGPERQAARLRGWTPTMTDSGCIEWRSPTGRYYVVESNDRPLVDYPTWLQILINESIATARAEALRCNQATSSVESDSESDVYPEEPALFRPSREDEIILDRLAQERAYEYTSFGMEEVE